MEINNGKSQGNEMEDEVLLLDSNISNGFSSNQEELIGICDTVEDTDDPEGIKLVVEYVIEDHCLSELDIGKEHLNEYEKGPVEHNIIIFDAQKHKCSHCDYETSYLDDLERHSITSHKIEDEYKCNFCDYSSSHKEVRDYHMETEHNLLYPAPTETKSKVTEKVSGSPASHVVKFKCDLCFYLTGCWSDLECHNARIHLKEIDHECEFCSGESLQDTPESINLHKCDQCDYSTKYLTSFNRHKESHIQKRYKCGKCDYSTCYRSNIKRHLDGKCKYSLERTESLTESKNSRNTFYKCDNCEYKTVHLDFLTRHMRSHLRYKCENCDYSASTQLKLKRHNEYKHLKIKRYQCEYCDHSTVTLDCMKRHTNTLHFKERVFECDSCEYKTYHMPFLKRHKRIHLNFRCDDCGFISSHRSELNRHKESVHLKTVNVSGNSQGEVQGDVISMVLGDKVYQCELCEYSTKYQTPFNRHKQLHRKFRCESCDFSAADQGKLDEHKEEIHGEDDACGDEK